MNNFITNLLVDIVKRFLAKTPKFFNIVKALAVATAIVTGLPLFLEQAGVVLPSAILAIQSKVVSIAALIAAFIAQLTVVPEQQEELKIK